ncbi:protein phosphatase 2C 50 [Cajanus cajan]|uniref:protein-serine/threonine phosphatase n=1 Tax=Cajanus cajan TaxID=3821 RepID=A0A151SS05_CAJCA|nr:protein phosphatase 2C 50 [Cajanus cajan]XP_020227343.1 protein phosphatase 2C 50 [Cajanus cajan]XP_020227344.1 protein phosphatase 2C 50 [Cajanus cajan]XP_020227345.1 protein phosphatase 2C 50 [Cajanus cajan]XP_020227346.1 protein phosphatase 2C 50 [Cajanus cajan]XP_020227347.1 protein phosphatase 2C 50 [Cajanus cajan]KYP57573.1 putative protein phosphatase 2C 6 [Cajanus cajan]
MEEISSSVAVPFTLGVGNLIQKESAVTTHMEITGLKLMANTAAATLMLNPAVECCQSCSVGSENHADISLQHQITVSAEVKENQVGTSLVSEMVIECESNWVLNESHNMARKEDEIMLAVDFQCLRNSSSQPVANGKSAPCREEAVLLKTSYSEIDSPIIIKVDDVDIHGKSGIKEACPSMKPVENTVSVAMDITSEDQCGSDESDPKPSAMPLDQLPRENKTMRTSNQNALDLNSGPLWGCSSICGMRQEMEDAISVRPQLFQVPSQMLMNDHVNENDKHSLAHFFGVYDGHGGLQVANYCQEHLHSVLIEEIEAAQSSLVETNARDWQDRWKKAFINCFQKVDNEVGGIGARNSGNNSGGSESNIEPVAPETAGSTAVVTILSQTHIIVANCGDSRTVLYRGKEAMPLSSDHKPNREDERARIEAAGGRVIHWKGYRVLGVLAMSRSIGDRYLKPWIIPDPEVSIVRREKNDECLILASDGLWDVMTNEEACEVAKKRILLWHKKYGENGATEHSEGADPASQSAAEYLTKLAIHRGSQDNISVIVIDLKPQRKIKRKA